jgi:mRNA-degrading endonuclease RelE of RelBE toxin-antitoxin system
LSVSTPRGIPVQVRHVKKKSTRLSVRVPPSWTRCITVHGRKTKWRIRVGDYRVIYDVFDDALTVTIVRAAHRREAYSR